MSASANPLLTWLAVAAWTPIVIGLGARLFIFTSHDVPPKHPTANDLSDFEIPNLEPKPEADPTVGQTSS